MSDDQDKVIRMTESEIELLVERTVLRTFERFGINTKDPIQVQGEFKFVHDWKAAIELIRNRAIVTTIGLLVAGALAVLWLGIKAIINR